MLRRALKGELFYLMGAYCVICGKPATDMHECFVNKGAVMARPKSERRVIDTLVNVVPLCNYCNTNITHAGEVKARREKLRHLGMENELACGIYTRSEEDLMQIGAEIVQRWIDSLDLHAHQSVWALAELGVRDETDDSNGSTH